MSVPEHQAQNQGFSLEILPGRELYGPVATNFMNCVKYSEERHKCFNKYSTNQVQKEKHK
jgi:hypothetical protein